MNSIKYIGLDVHQSTISVAVLDREGKLVMQRVLATQVTAILDFLHGLRGSLHVTFEEGTHSAWLYDLLVRRVAKLVVCNPRKNALLKAGNKSDTIDARKLAELLRAGLLSPVYHGENSAQTMKQLVGSYAALTEDTTRIMGRLKALYRSQAIACAGKKPYQPVVQVWMRRQEMLKYPQAWFVECAHGNGDAQAAGEARGHLDCAHRVSVSSGTPLLPAAE